MLKGATHVLDILARVERSFIVIVAVGSLGHGFRLQSCSHSVQFALVGCLKMLVGRLFDDVELRRSILVGDGTGECAFVSGKLLDHAEGQDLVEVDAVEVARVLVLADDRMAAERALKCDL